MEPLLDPVNDRFMRDMPGPPALCLFTEMLFPNTSSIPDWITLKSHLIKEGRVSKSDFLQIVSQARQLFAREPNLLQVIDPVTIIGDIHGQFYDLLKILDLGGDLEHTKLLFLGDFVDRGSFSIEILLLLYSLKINFPSRVFMLRGNHECRQLTTFFNFRKECLYKYDIEAYDAVMDSFDALPLACVVNKKFLALHGGISPGLKTLSNISSITRFAEPPRQGIFCDLLWADPIDSDTGVCEENFKPNEARGCSNYYGKTAVNRFLKKNKLFSVIRAHEVQIDGYKTYWWNGADEFPVVITVFSAPNYCDVYRNRGAIVKFNNGVLNIQQYSSSEHPYILPNFMDIFSWSIPFVTEKILEMLYNMLKASKRSEETERRIEEEMKIEQRPKIKRTSTFRKKVRAITNMMKTFKDLRVDNESILKMQGLYTNAKISKEIVRDGGDAVIGAVESFYLAKKLDKSNEQIPEYINL